MSATTEQDILDRLYQAIGEARKHTMLIADPIRLRMLVFGKTDYDRLYEAMETIEGCARQMIAWREDTRWGGVSAMVGTCLVNLRNWATADSLPLFLALLDFLDKCEFTCRGLQHQATGRRGAILPEMFQADRDRNSTQVMLPGSQTLQ